MVHVIFSTQADALFLLGVVTLLRNLKIEHAN